MTWNELQQLISMMTAAEREQGVVYIDDYFGPDRRAVEVEFVRAFDDLYVGLSVSNECVLRKDESFLADLKDDVAAEPP